MDVYSSVVSIYLGRFTCFVGKSLDVIETLCYLQPVDIQQYRLISSDISRNFEIQSENVT